jgi:branched-chain amino acid transport system ATP-binding protein
MSQDTLSLTSKNLLLSVKNISAFYGKSQALFDVSLEVKAGEVVALMGRNGVGKSTTIRAICNLTPAATGEIKLVGKNITKLASHKIAQSGIGLVPEGRRCFPNLTVYENLVATARKGTIEGTKWDLSKINTLFPRLTERYDQVAATLSGGEQQMLAIGRALLTNPKLLILDEATEGLAPIVRQEIWTAIRQLREAGQSILLVDKTLSELLPVCDRCFILEKGQSVWNGIPVELNDEISSRYLGVSSQ